MLPFIFLLFMCSNFLLIMSEDVRNVTIKVIGNDNCVVSQENYHFTEGQNVTLVVEPKNMHINYGWWNVNTSIGFIELTDKLKTLDSNSKTDNTKPPIVFNKTVDTTMAGTWEFKFYFYYNIPVASPLPKKLHIDGQKYTMSVCKTNVTIEPTPKPSNAADIRFIIIACTVFSIMVVIILAQAGYIVYLKSEAKKLITLNTHNNLSKKSESFSNDTARYCSNPRQKKKETIPVEKNNRDSVIYEAPNIEITSNGRMPMQPPQPPAITTMPHREFSVANRPPLPLPNQGYPDHETYQELYEEMETEEENYMPPPECNTMPPRLPMPPKKVPTTNLMGVKENTLKNRPGNSKPPVTPKPQGVRAQTAIPGNELEQALKRRNNGNRETTLPRGPPPGHMMQPQHQEQSYRKRPTGDAQTNELQEALKRRNNVLQVPVVSIPDPSLKSNSPIPKPIPPPVQKSKPPPMRHPVQEEIYYNEASDEEEWTYEPLKPLNSYDQNIYNI